jgi:hypothetical protein
MEQRMELNIVNEIAALRRLTVGRLRQRFEEVFGEATKTSNKTWLVKPIARRLLVLPERDLTEQDRRNTVELAKDTVLWLNISTQQYSCRDHAGQRSS